MRKLRRVKLALPCALAVLCSPAAAQTIDDLRTLSIDQLANIDVTSVLRRPQSLSDTPAAVYVISSDEIRRSGAITLAEALRLAPNLEVARFNSPSYAVSARGFNGIDSSNKLLVMIDGRSIYSPIHSGVFWDQIQVPLDDIDRIEVISGPGGTQWGANAVNGVISIITKNSRDTQGGLIDLKAGPVDQNGLIRYGGRFSENGTFRIYGQGFGNGHTVLPNGSSAGDDWHGGQVGFPHRLAGPRRWADGGGRFLPQYRRVQWPAVRQQHRGPLEPPVR
ncbi:MAG: TonB-dependent receptor plug domain-containing protein [Acetobacteraceae bacterium]